MQPRLTPFAFALSLSLLTICSWAQAPSVTLSGKVTNASGDQISNAKVSIKNLTTGQATETATDANGNYTSPNLAPGDYEISVTAQGFSPRALKTTITAANPHTFDISLTAEGTSGAQTATPPGNLPNAPSSTTQPSLSDLGFPEAQTRANPQEQALLDKRSRMLKTHQKLGLITTAPLIATVITGLGAGGKHTSNTDRNVHAVLGSATAGLYFTSAAFAIFAPKIKGTPTRGPIRLHKALAWIHGPGMVLTPILGAMAYSQKNNGEKVHGLASAHAPVAIVTAGAYGAALLAVSVKF